MWEWCNGPSGTRQRFLWLMDTFLGHSIHRPLTAIMSASLLPHRYSASQHTDTGASMHFFKMATSSIWTFRFITGLHAGYKRFALPRGQTHQMSVLIPGESGFPFHFPTTLKGLNWCRDKKGFKVMVWAGSNGGGFLRNS